MAGILSLSDTIAHDSASKANLDITYAHAAVHRDIIAGLSVRSSGNTQLLFRTPADPVEIHLLFAISAGGAIEYNFVEDVTTTVDGTPVTTYRLNRKSEKTTQSLAFLDPTYSGGDTLLAGSMGGGPGQGVTDSVALHTDAEFVLKPATDYVIEVTGSQDVTFAAEWYEVGV